MESLHDPTNTNLYMEGLVLAFSTVYIYIHFFSLYRLPLGTDASVGFLGFLVSDPVLINFLGSYFFGLSAYY